MGEWLAVIFYGVLEGITEFLPISSTGHLLVAQQWLPRQSDLFNVVIQSAAVIAVIPVFWDRVRQLIRLGQDREALVYWLKLFLAFAITAVGGLILEAVGLKLPETAVPVAIALIVGGLLFLVIERQNRQVSGSYDISWSIAAEVGIAQLIAAIFPGLSRSGACIIWLLYRGVDRTVATEFSFLLGIPTILAAGFLKVAEALVHRAYGLSGTAGLQLIVAMLVSAVVSFLSVRWLIGYIRTHSFEPFGWYRIGVGMLVLLLLL